MNEAAMCQTLDFKPFCFGTPKSSKTKFIKFHSAGAEELIITEKILSLTHFPG